MLTSLSFVFLLGLAMAALCQRIKIPRIIGMLITGILLGPCVLNWLSDSVLGDFFRAAADGTDHHIAERGLSLNLADLKKVGRPALMMSCVPASFEILAFVIFAPTILHISRVEAAVMGAVLGAVSPAVVIPRMVQLMETKYGTDQRIPQMIMQVRPVMIFSSLSCFPRSQIWPREAVHMLQISSISRYPFFRE